MSDLRNTANQADLIVIAHPTALGADRDDDVELPPGVEARQPGITSKIAMIQDVYDEFGDGLARPASDQELPRLHALDQPGRRLVGSQAGVGAPDRRRLVRPQAQRHVVSHEQLRPDTDPLQGRSVVRLLRQRQHPRGRRRERLDPPISSSAASRRARTRRPRRSSTSSSTTSRTRRRGTGGGTPSSSPTAARTTTPGSRSSGKTRTPPGATG